MAVDPNTPEKEELTTLTNLTIISLNGDKCKLDNTPLTEQLLNVRAVLLEVQGFAQYSNYSLVVFDKKSKEGKREKELVTKQKQIANWSVIYFTKHSVTNLSPRIGEGVGNILSPYLLRKKPTWMNVRRGLAPSLLRLVPS